MDDKNQPLNQLNNQPKDDQQADVSSSAPVEMEPSTQGAPMPSQPPVQASGPSPVQPPTASPAPSMNQPEAQTPPAPDMSEGRLPAPPQQQLLEEPKKKNGMVIAAIVVVLVIVLALVGIVVYNALY